MTDKPLTTITPQDLDARYQRAALLYKATLDTNHVAHNTILMPHWIEGADCFWYRRKTHSGVEFRLVNAETSANLLAFDHKALGAALAKMVDQEIATDNLPIENVRITLSPLQVRFTAFDKRYHFDAKTQHCQAIEPELLAHHSERLVSPDERKIAFIYEFNIWIKDTETGEEYALTKDGEQYNAYGASPQGWGFQIPNIQACWSPDSKRLFTLQTDCRRVKSVPLIEHVPHDGSLRPSVSEIRCAFPGDEHIEEQRLLSIDVQSGTIQLAQYHAVPVNRSTWGLFIDNLAWWGQDSQLAYFVDMDRGDQIARVIEFDTHTGTTRQVFEERSSSFINLSPNEITAAALLPLPDSNELIWFSERNGWGHLYLYDLESGECKNAITQGEWVVREILHFDREKRELWIQAGGRIPTHDPYYLDICIVDVDTGDIKTIASTNHEYIAIGGCVSHPLISTAVLENWRNHTVAVSPSSRFVVTTRSRVDQVPVSLLITRDGETRCEIETADVFGLPNDWQWPEPVQLLGADSKTNIYGVVFRPSDFNPNKQYPIIDFSYCSGFYAPFTPKGSFDNTYFYLLPAFLSELGFVVVMLEGRGTGYRDRSFSASGYGWLPAGNSSEDRVSGIRQLADRYPYMDINRVGIMGQYGSVGAVYGMLEHPDFYKVGVSHGLQDPRLMCSVYGERHEGVTPENRVNKYAESMVANLRGKLLLIHNQLDRKTNASTTWRIVEALQKANKDFDLLMLPTHDGSSGHTGSRHYAWRRTCDYFVRNLLGVEPPREFDFIKGADSV